MKGIKHCFLRECKERGIKITIGGMWCCKWNVLIVPPQKTDLDLFIGFHELAHAILHKGDKRDYDDLKSRIDIEIEADNLANDLMKKYGYPYQSNDYTHGLIALYLYEGNEMNPYTISVADNFISLNKKVGKLYFEVFSQFISNLPLHPALY